VLSSAKSERKPKLIDRNWTKTENYTNRLDWGQVLFVELKKYFI
jgi:hypothetical protein